MKRIQKLALLALVGLLASLPASAEDACGDEESWGDCLARLFSAGSTFQHAAGQAQAEMMKPENQQAVDARSENEIVNALVGTASGSEVNLEDFLSSLLANLDIDGLEESNGGLKFKKNIQVTYGTLAVEAQAKRGELFPELKTKLEEAGSDSLITDLDEELGDFDDLSLDLVFSVDRFGEDNAIWWGRKFRASNGTKTPNGELATKIYGLIASAPQDRYKAATKAFQEAVRAPTQSLASKNVKDTPDSVRADLQAKAKAAADAALADIKGLEQRLKDNRYFMFGKLVANQPQFSVTVGYDTRDELVGRDSLKAQVKYEIGQANVNGLRRSCKTLTLDCYSKFLNQQAPALKKNWRVSFEGKYSWMDAYDFTHPDTMVTLDLDEAQEWHVMLSAGRTLRLTDTGIEQTRFELEATYEDVTGDTQKQGRFVSTATFTERISDTMAVSVGVVYANRPEFRGEVDEELSARAGLRFKLDRQDKGSQTGGSQTGGSQTGGSQTGG